MPFSFFGGLEVEMIFRLLIAVLLGALIGIEREAAHRPAGLRTHMLVSLGAAIFTIVSISFAEDPARIAAAIVTGIGFIGAGSVIALRGHVQGITTAASLWVAASIGLGVGVGAYMLSLIGAVLVFVILLVGRVEKSAEIKK